MTRIFGQSLSCSSLHMTLECSLLVANRFCSITEIPMLFVARQALSFGVIWCLQPVKCRLAATATLAIQRPFTRCLETACIAFKDMGRDALLWHSGKELGIKLDKSRLGPEPSSSNVWSCIQPSRAWVLNYHQQHAIMSSIFQRRGLGLVAPTEQTITLELSRKGNPVLGKRCGSRSRQG